MITFLLFFPIFLTLLLDKASWNSFYQFYSSIAGAFFFFEIPIIFVL